MAGGFGIIRWNRSHRKSRNHNIVTPNSGFAKPCVQEKHLRSRAGQDMRRRDVACEI